MTKQGVSYHPRQIYRETIPIPAYNGSTYAGKDGAGSAALSAPAPRVAQLQAYSAIANGAPAQQQSTEHGNLPSHLQSGIESLSGISMHDVQVHYNSSKPAQLQAHAYAQGTDIHLAPGQERHLPHEAWHVVQQKQGRVKPTLQMKGVAINDDSALEREADVMGARAMGGGATTNVRTSFMHLREALIQRVVTVTSVTAGGRPKTVTFEKSDIENKPAGMFLTVSGKRYSLFELSPVQYGAADATTQFSGKIGMKGITVETVEALVQAEEKKKDADDLAIAQQRQADKAASDALTLKLLGRASTNYAASSEKHSAEVDADSAVVGNMDRAALRAFAVTVMESTDNRKKIQKNNADGSEDIWVDIGQGECLVVNLSLAGAARVFHIGPGAGVA